MENAIKTILEKLTGLETNVGDIRRSLDEFEQKVDQNFKDTSESIAGVMTMVSQRFDEVNARLDRIEKSHGYRLDTLERDVAVLKA